MTRRLFEVGLVYAGRSILPTLHRCVDIIPEVFSHFFPHFFHHSGHALGVVFIKSAQMAWIRQGFETCFV